MGSAFDASAHIPPRSREKKMRAAKKGKRGERREKKAEKEGKKKKEKIKQTRVEESRNAQRRARETVGDLKMISTVRQSEGSSGVKKARNENGNADSYGDANREGTPERE